MAEKPLDMNFTSNSFTVSIIINASKVIFYIITIIKLEQFPQYASPLVMNKPGPTSRTHARDSGRICARAQHDFNACLIHYKYYILSLQL